jgi:hypothetical protein
MMRTRRALRLGSVLALAVCVLAQLAGSVHSAAVRHVACQEHGGVVEVHAQGGERARPEKDAITVDESELHHAHCERCATPSGRGATRPRLPAQRLARLSAPATAPVATPPASLPRFRLAPKGSPPRSSI